MDNTPANKYILCPDYKPLFDMAKCFGPTHGPLERPCLTPIKVIHGLLSQTGKDAVTIYEVTRTKCGRTSAPVQLTLENYMLPYEEILEGKKVPAVTMKSEPAPAAVKPVITVANSSDTTSATEDEPSPKAVEEEPVLEAKESSPEEYTETPSIEPEITQTEEIPAETLAGETETPVAEVEIKTDTATTDPYAGMTKAQRKAARRAAAEAAAVEAASTEQ